MDRFNNKMVLSSRCFHFILCLWKGWSQDRIFANNITIHSKILLHLEWLKINVDWGGQRNSKKIKQVKHLCCMWQNQIQYSGPVMVLWFLQNSLWCTKTGGSSEHLYIWLQNRKKKEKCMMNQYHTPVLSLWS